jgi:hypothetical protein
MREMKAQAGLTAVAKVLGIGSASIIGCYKPGN